VLTVFCVVLPLLLMMMLLPRLRLMLLLMLPNISWLPTISPWILTILLLRRFSLKYQLLRTLLHICHYILSYFAMLIFMTYNVGLCIALVLGSALAFFLFARKGGTEEASADCCE